jgi:hypothetical protein
MFTLHRVQRLAGLYPNICMLLFPPLDLSLTDDHL